MGAVLLKKILTFEESPFGSKFPAGPGGPGGPGGPWGPGGPTGPCVESPAP